LSTHAKEWVIESAAGTASVIDGPPSVVFAQAANRLPTEQAMLAKLVGA